MLLGDNVRYFFIAALLSLTGCTPQDNCEFVNGYRAFWGTPQLECPNQVKERRAKHRINQEYLACLRRIPRRLHRERTHSLAMACLERADYEECLLKKELGTHESDFFDGYCPYKTKKELDEIFGSAKWGKPDKCEK